MRTTTTKNSKAKKTKKEGRSKQTTNVKNRIFLQQARNITKVIKEDPGVKDDKQFMLHAVTVWGYQFENCSETLQEDIDIIKAAVANNPENIFKTYFGSDYVGEDYPPIYDIFFENIMKQIKI